MIDIYEYIKLDHKKVDKLFNLYETSASEKNKLEIAAQLNQELTVHARAEEETLYKVLEQHRKSKDEARHGEKEHQEIRNKLAEITKIKQVNEGLDIKIVELKKLVEHHVSEEEGKIFSEAKDVISPELAYKLKEEMHFVKGQLILKEFSS